MATMLETIEKQKDWIANGIRRAETSEHIKVELRTIEFALPLWRYIGNDYGDELLQQASQKCKVLLRSVENELHGYNQPTDKLVEQTNLKQLIRELDTDRLF